MRRGIRLALPVLFIALFACNRSNEAPTAEPSGTASESNAPPAPSRGAPTAGVSDGQRQTKTAPELDWAMARDGAQLRIAYTVTNNTTRRLLIFDRLLGGHPSFVTATSVVVHNSGTPGTVAFTRGYVRSFGKTGKNSWPAGRVIEPGKKLASVAVVPLPLRAWHNFGAAAPLDQPVTLAVLQVGWAEDPGPDGWVRMLKDGAGVPNILRSGRQKLVRSAPTLIPRD